MAAAIRRGLSFEGLIIDLAADGEEALRMRRTRPSTTRSCWT